MQIVAVKLKLKERVEKFEKCRGRFGVIDREKEHSRNQTVSDNWNNQ